MSSPINVAREEAAADALYALLPAHIRSVDAANGWALKALIRVLAGGAVEIDREIDKLYDSLFVETASDTALEDLAALVASEPLRPLPPGSAQNKRAFVANTVRYRRGKGTARVLEGLAADVGGFGSMAVEYFQRLSRLQHVLDVRADRPGVAFLVPGTTAAHTGTGFDALPRLVDVRSIARAAGRHHTGHVGIHVLRPVVPVFPSPKRESALSLEALAGVPAARPWTDGVTHHPGYFQLAAQPGRPLRLFNPDRRSQSGGDRVVDTDLRDRLRRLPLHLETEELRRIFAEMPSARPSETQWFDGSGQPFEIFVRAEGATTFEYVKPREILIANLETMPPSGARPASSKTYTWFEGGKPAPVAKTKPVPIRCGFDPVTGRLIVAAPAAGQPDIEEVRIAYGTGIGWEIGAGPQDRNTDEVPFDITDSGSVAHFVRIVDATQSESGSPNENVRQVRTLHKALSEWQAGGAGKRGLIILTRCDRESAAVNATEIHIATHPGSELHIVSAQWRPRVVKPGLADNRQRLGYVVRRERRFTIDAPLRVTASAAPATGGRPGVLVLDGLELTGGISLGPSAISRMLIRHSTVREPHNSALSTTAGLNGAEISIDRSIVGRIGLDVASGTSTGSLVITDSIVSADDPANGAISATSLGAHLKNVTILGSSTFKSLEATNVIFSGRTTVTRHQSGCVRYSSLAPQSSTPRRFRCQPDLALAAAAKKKESPLTPDEKAAVALGVAPIFLDTSLDEPTVAMLHPLTREAIRLGGEHDAEMGVFSAAAAGLRVANLLSLFDDYVPFGLEAGVIDDTRSSAVASQRNRP